MHLHPANPIPDQIATARDLVDLVATGKRVCAAVSGPPGLGKTRLVTSVLKRRGVRFEVVDGSPAGLITKAFEFAEGGVLLLDDADGLVIGGGTRQANLLKRLLAPEPIREIVNETKKAQNDDDLTPSRFITRCGVIWVTNLDIQDSRLAKSQQRRHLDALKSRGIRPVEITNEPHWSLDYLLHQITERDLLRPMGLTRAQAQDVVDFVCRNAWRLDELSIRCVKEIAQIRHDLPQTWERNLRRLLRATPCSAAPCPRPPRVLTPAERAGGISEPSVIVPPPHHPRRAAGAPS